MKWFKKFWFIKICNTQYSAPSRRIVFGILPYLNRFLLTLSNKFSPKRHFLEQQHSRKYYYIHSKQKHELLFEILEKNKLYLYIMKKWFHDIWRLVHTALCSLSQIFNIFRIENINSIFGTFLLRTICRKVAKKLITHLKCFRCKQIKSKIVLTITAKIQKIKIKIWKNNID